MIGFGKVVIVLVGPTMTQLRKAIRDEDFYPTYVEVSFSNVCNFKCGYCGQAFSSKWGDEIREHGAYTFNPTNWKYNQLDEYSKTDSEREENPT